MIENRFRIERQILLGRQSLHRMPQATEERRTGTVSATDQGKKSYCGLNTSLTYSIAETAFTETEDSEVINDGDEDDRDNNGIDMSEHQRTASASTVRPPTPDPPPISFGSRSRDSEPPDSATIASGSIPSRAGSSHRLRSLGGRLKSALPFTRTTLKRSSTVWTSDSSDDDEF